MGGMHNGGISRVRTKPDPDRPLRLVLNCEDILTKAHVTVFTSSRKVMGNSRWGDEARIDLLPSRTEVWLWFWLLLDSGILVFVSRDLEILSGLMPLYLETRRSPYIQARRQFRHVDNLGLALRIWRASKRRAEVVTISWRGRYWSICRVLIKCTACWCLISATPWEFNARPFPGKDCLFYGPTTAYSRSQAAIFWRIWSVGFLETESVKGFKGCRKMDALSADNIS